MLNGRGTYDTSEKLELALRRSRFTTALSGLLAATVLTGVTVLTAAPALADDSPSGSAYALSARTTLLNEPLVTIDPVPTAAYPEGGDESVVKLGPTAGGLVNAKLLNASSALSTGTLLSKASIAEVTVKDILRAELVTAECTAAGEELAGKSSIAKLDVLGQKVDLKTAPNTVIDVLGVAKVIINEQVRQAGTLTVNAVHVTVNGPVRGIASADIVLSQARCALGGGTPTTEPSAPTTTTTTGTSTSAPPTSTTSTEPSVPTTTTAPGGGSDGDGTNPGGIDPVGNSGDLAETGVSGVFPLVLIGAVLLVAGAGAFFFTNRRRRAADNADSDE